jgi:hypothetical protein
MASESSTETRSERRLAAILAADVAGFARLMGRAALLRAGLPE